MPGLVEDLLLVTSNLARRSNVLALEESMQGVDPEFKEGLNHYFGFQTYAREMTLPADSLVVGKLHRFPCINFLTKGKVSVGSEEGNEVVEAPATWISPKGTKRAIYVIEDCIWTTVHGNPTNTQDLEELEKALIAESYAALEDL